MRRLDQDQLKAPCRAVVWCRASLSPRKTMSARGELERPPQPFASEWTLTGLRVLNPREYCRMTRKRPSAPATTNSRTETYSGGGSNGIGRPRGSSAGSGLRLRRISAGFAGLIELGDILCQEIIQHGADGGDHRELGDVVPGRRHGRAHDVGGKREFQRQQDPSGEFQPDLPAMHLVGGALEDQRRCTPASA